MEVFWQSPADTVAPYRPIDRAIDLEPEFTKPYGRIYHLSDIELQSLQVYILMNLANGFIQWSSLSVAALILFVKKKDSGLQPFVDYRVLNSRTVKNQDPLPGISHMLDRLSRARIFRKLDQRNVWNFIRIKEEEELKTTFQTRYGQCKYRVMSFRLQNAPVTFQTYIDNCLRSYIDDWVIRFLDDILMYSTNEKEYEDHVQKVPERLCPLGLFCKAEKSQFGASIISFLGFIISYGGVGMESDRLSSIEDWPTAKSIRDIQVLLGFSNC